VRDARLSPANTRVAHRSLRDQAGERQIVDGEERQVLAPLADICGTPNGPRLRQALFGETVLVLEERDGQAFVQTLKDGYVGYIQAANLCPPGKASHWVSAAATHLYPRADIKSRAVVRLPFGARLSVEQASAPFTQTNGGFFVPSAHIRPLQSHMDCPATVAALFLGTPYLWGGNSRDGIDCSGIVQAAMLACNIPCPADSDMQEAELGTTLCAGEKHRRNDLLFWKGHVGLCVDDQTLIHANAHHMAVAFEGISAAITRINAQGGGPVTAHKRV